MGNSINSSLNASCGAQAEEQASLSKRTTLHVGGPAEWLAEPKTIDEAIELIQEANRKKINLNVIGAGSNLLISDQGLQGLTICTRKFHGCHLDSESGMIEVMGGEPLPSIARRASKTGLRGLEWAIGIPGTAGGAVVMNAGAQGGCIADTLQSITAICLVKGKTFEIKAKDLKLSYRDSLLQHEPLFVLSAKFKLEAGNDPEKLTSITNSNLLHRTNTQPYHLPNCGSVFRNPEPLKAGRIIAELGFKGHKIGGAEVSMIHANFITNDGHAKAKDVLHLIREIQEKVKKVHGFTLRTEVKRLGFD